MCSVSQLTWPMQALKGGNEDEVDAMLDRVMMLFRYLQEKDVFEKYYKQHLAKRLLSGRAVSSHTSPDLLHLLRWYCSKPVTCSSLQDVGISSWTMWKVSSWASTPGMTGPPLHSHIVKRVSAQHTGEAGSQVGFQAGARATSKDTSTCN